MTDWCPHFEGNYKAYLDFRVSETIVDTNNGTDNLIIIFPMKGCCSLSPQV